MIIRISIAEDKQIDWTVPSTETITFSDVLDAIYQASDDQLIVTAFDYMDEEDDVITVKNDDDLHSMIQFHLSNAHQSSSQFISIYPKLCKNPGKRNKFGLKVSISQPVRVPANHASHRNTRPTVGQPASSLGELNRTTQAVEKIEPGHHGDLVDGKPGVKPTPQASEIESLSNLAFTFIQTLGNGNSGVVYKVNHKSTNMTMAVKSIGIDLTGQEQDSIKSELAILSRCNSSPQIIDFYGAYFDENRIYLCTEYMDGGSLDRYGRIPEAVLKRVCYRVVSGLKFLWDERIMHRDVKPSNMLVNTRGQVKLCDFGVSRQLVNSIAQTYIGTNAYMAPERVVGFEYTIYSDIWSLGLSICEMATGHFPYPELANKIKGSHGVVPMEVMQCIVNDAPPRLPECGYSAEIMDFVKGCLQKEAGSRLSPKELSDHNFVKIDSFSDYEDPVIAKWVLGKASLIAE